MGNINLAGGLLQGLNQGLQAGQQQGLQYQLKELQMKKLKAEMDMAKADREERQTMLQNLPTLLQRLNQGVQGQGTPAPALTPEAPALGPRYPTITEEDIQPGEPPAVIPPRPAPVAPAPQTQTTQAPRVQPMWGLEGFTFTDKGHMIPKIGLNKGTVQHEYEPTDDGRMQTYRLTLDQGGNVLERVPIGPPQAGSDAIKRLEYIASGMVKAPPGSPIIKEVAAKLGAIEMGTKDPAQQGFLIDQLQREVNAIGPALKTPPKTTGGTVGTQAPALAQQKEQGYQSKLPSSMDFLGAVKAGNEIAVDQAAKLAEARTLAELQNRDMDQPTKQKAQVYLETYAIMREILTKFTPEERQKYVGMFGQALRTKQFADAVKEFMGDNTDPKLQEFAALMSRGQALAFTDGGKQLTQQEKDITFGYIPTGKELSWASFEAKVKAALDKSHVQMDQLLSIETTPRKQIRQEMQQRMAPFTPKVSEYATTPEQEGMLSHAVDLFQAGDPNMTEQALEALASRIFRNPKTAKQFVDAAKKQRVNLVPKGQ